MSRTTVNIELDLSDVKVNNVKTDKSGHYHIYVVCTATSTKCHGCGRQITKSNGLCKETIIEHTSIFDKRVFIHVRWPRFECDFCDNKPTTSFHPGWLNETGSMTKPFENHLLRDLINSTVKDVGEKHELTEEIIEGVLERRISTEPNWNTEIKKIGIDEIALRKGHKQYLTIVSDITQKKDVRILKVLKGRTKDDVLPFLKTIPKNIVENLDCICVDMGDSFISSVKGIIPDFNEFNRIVTIDRFHVAQLLSSKVDNERKKILHELKKQFKDDEEKLDSIKNTMWPFRKHGADLDEEENKAIANLFELSPRLKIFYDLREDFYEIFQKKDLLKSDAKDEIELWIKRTESTDSKQLKSFVKTYKQYSTNILNYFKDRNTSGPVEGLNNKIKVIKRRGFGFRNITNFAKRLFLDINNKKTFFPSPERANT